MSSYGNSAIKPGSVRTSTHGIQPTSYLKLDHGTPVLCGTSVLCVFLGIMGLWPPALVMVPGFSWLPYSSTFYLPRFFLVSWGWRLLALAMVPGCCFRWLFSTSSTSLPSSSSRVAPWLLREGRCPRPRHLATAIRLWGYPTFLSTILPIQLRFIDFSSNL